MRRLPLRMVALGFIAGAALLTAAAVVWLQRDSSDASARDAQPERCAGLADAAARSCYTLEFLATVDGVDDPRPAVQEATAAAWRAGGFLLSNCHGIMHTVGRTYAREEGVTLATLMRYLPRSNDPGCSAGFAHGLVTGAAPSIDASRPGAANAVCAEAETRYQRYSCTHGFGHAFMRMQGGRLAPALDLCLALGRRHAADCGQGAFHDYWFSVIGADDAAPQEEPVTDPRVLCGGQREVFVRPCWYRAYVDNRPAGIVVDSPEHLDVLCDGLVALQRAACITAASVIGPPDPTRQLELCAGLAQAADAEACVRGTKVQNLLGSRISSYVELAGGCERFADQTRIACYRWLGKVVTVVTDGEFARTGCTALPSESARRECASGARSSEDALATFS